MLFWQKKSSRLAAVASTALTVVVLAACGGGGSSLPGPAPAQKPVIPTAGSLSLSLPQAGVTNAALPGVDGFSESISFPANDAPSGTTLALTISSGTPSGMPALAADMHVAQPFLYLALQPNHSVTLDNYPGFTMKLPAGVKPDALPVKIGFYDPATGWKHVGDLTMVGSTATFTPTGSTHIALNANAIYYAITYTCGGPSPSPSPSPTSTSTSYPLAAATPLTIPPFAGWSGDWVAASNDAPAGTVVRLTSSVEAPAGAPSPSAIFHPMFARPPTSKFFVSSTYSSSSKASRASTSSGITFAKYPAVEFDLPTGFDTSGLTFKLETFDLTTGALLDTELGTASGTGPVSVSFPGTNSPFIALTAHTYLWEFVTQSTASPSPSPSPSPLPSPSPSPLPSPSASVGTITEYPIPSPAGTAFDITTGPDGNLWFTELNGNELGKITTKGVVSQYSVAAASTNYITTGADGNLWFTDSQTATVTKMTTSGSQSPYIVCGGAGGSAQSITTGPDGNVWFTDNDALGTTCDNIGKITPAGTVSEYPSGSSFPFVTVGVTPGSDGNMWYVWNGSGPEAGSFCKMSTSGSIVACYPLTHEFATSITAGPDGNLWFTNGYNAVCKDTSTGGILTCYTTAFGSDPQGIAVGPDGNLWFTEIVGNKIGRVTTSGTITEYSLPPGSTSPKYITKGPDGNMWFTEAGKIGKIVP